MPEGTRLQLDPRVSAEQIRAWGCTGPCFTIARALQDYGMYVIDNSGREKVMLEYEGTANWKGIVNSRTVRPIPLDAFKVVLDAKPKLKALVGVARPGKIVRLPYLVYDGGGETREEATVYRNGRVVARLVRALHAAQKGVAYGFSWRAPRVLEGKLRFCVRAWDPAGNETGPRCARLKIAPTS